MRSTIKNKIYSAAGVVCMIILTTAAVLAQTQTPIAQQLTQAQAQALIQMLVAQSQATGRTQLTPDQQRMLAQFLALQTQAGTTLTAMTPAQAQGMVQAVQAQQGLPALPGTIQAAAQPAANGALAASPLDPKKAGVIRIGVVEPKAQMGQGNSGANVAEPLRSLLEQYLTGPQFEVLPIAAMLPSQIEAEGKAKACDYLLYSAISQKLKSGAMGFLKKAGPFTSMIPMVGAMGSMGGMMAGAAASTAISGAASIAGTVKAKSEVTFDYQLMIPGNTTAVLSNSLKAKAHQDGEDIVTPLIEQTATAIIAQVTRKQ